MALSSEDRSALKSRYLAIRERICRAADRSKRSPLEVTLLGASKMQPIDLMRELDDIAAERGESIRFGENYVQEMAKKRAEIKTKAKWHFIGRLQSNKIRDLVPWCDCIETLASESHAAKLNKELAGGGKMMPVFFQVNISSDPKKGGISPEDVPTLFRAVYEECSFLQLMGIMTITEFNLSESEIRKAYRAMREIAAKLESIRPGAPIEISMGMSDDFEIAIEEGATEIRLGTVLFGPRN